MELIKSLTFDAAPTLTQLFKFALISILQTIKNVILLYPVNICLFVIICLIIFYKVTKLILPKAKFNHVYIPLKHNENSPEEIRVMKKEFR